MGLVWFRLFFGTGETLRCDDGVQVVKLGYQLGQTDTRVMGNHEKKQSRRRSEVYWKRGRRQLGFGFSPLAYWVHIWRRMNASGAKRLLFRRVDNPLVEERVQSPPAGSSTQHRRRHFAVGTMASSLIPKFSSVSILRCKSNIRSIYRVLLANGTAGYQRDGESLKGELSVERHVI